MMKGVPGGPPGGSNTINNSSTLSGWLEATGLDDLVATTCGCLLGVEEEPVPGPDLEKAFEQISC